MASPVIPPKTIEDSMRKALSFESWAKRHIKGDASKFRALFDQVKSGKAKAAPLVTDDAPKEVAAPPKQKNTLEGYTLSRKGRFPL